jgi:non-specific serine/threonine protein kinase
LVNNAPALLGARAFDVLLALIERRDRLVTKSELLDLVWPGVVVEENNLQVQISTLRKLLGADSIATVAGRGYRFTLEPSHAARPAPSSSQARKHNLPGQVASFIGRERELAELRQLLAANRLVTLTGVGGTGKTRLALQAAADVTARFPDGVWFIGLATVRSGDGVEAAVIHALAIRDDPARSAAAVLADHLRDRHALLLLDNCEHVIAFCAGLVAGLLQTCPDVTVLATSREPLVIDGERLFPVLPLATPASDSRPRDETDLARFAQHEAVLLFLDRAVSVVPGFQLTVANAPAIAQVCHRLDGIPLAIELAAGRAKTLSAEQIAERLGDRLRLLAGGGRDRLPRQQTLRAAIDWSYDLLPELERRVFERLSVFTGAVPLSLIEAVCTDAAVTRDNVLELLITLVDRSLVVSVEHDRERWYRLLETIRLYAAEKLAMTDQELAARRRDLEWYRQLAEEAGIVRLGAEASPWLARLIPLSEDLLSATESALHNPELAPTALDVIENLWWLWYRISIRRSLALLLKAAKLVGPNALRNEYPLIAWCAASLECAFGAGSALDAIRLADLARQGFRQRGDCRREAWALQALGIAHARLGDITQVEACWREAILLKRAVGDAVDLSVAISGLAETYYQQGDLVNAAAAYEEALSLVTPEEMADYYGPVILAGLGNVRLRLGDLSAAEVAFTEALQGGSYPWVRPCALAGLAGVAAARGHARRAACQMAAAEALLAVAAAEGIVLQPVDQADWARHAAAVQALEGEEGWGAGHVEGRALSEVGAVAYALGSREPL